MLFRPALSRRPSQGRFASGGFGQRGPFEGQPDDAFARRILDRHVPGEQAVRIIADRRMDFHQRRAAAIADDQRPLEQPAEFRAAGRSLGQGQGRAPVMGMSFSRRRSKSEMVATISQCVTRTADATRPARALSGS